MDFQRKLQQLVEDVEGGIACVLMGNDGLAVDLYQNPHHDLAFDAATFGVECTSIFHQLMNIAKQSNFDTPFEFTIRSEQYIAIFRFLSSEYFLLLTLDPQGNAGKGRYLLRTVVQEFHQELFS